MQNPVEGFLEVYEDMVEVLLVLEIFLTENAYVENLLCRAFFFFFNPAKTILQGTVKGGRRQVRQRKRWKDNIKEWTGLDFGKSQRAVENRGKWRKLVAKSSVVP